MKPERNEFVIRIFLMICGTFLWNTLIDFPSRENITLFKNVMSYILRHDIQFRFCKFLLEDDFLRSIDKRIFKLFKGYSELSKYCSV